MSGGSVSIPVALLRGEPMYEVGGRRVNRFDLYEAAVQSPEVQCRFFRALHGGEPLVLADDFSGAGGLARGWLGLSERYASIATDRDELPLAHAYVRATERFGEGVFKRFGLQRASVVEAGGHVDVAVALNFGVSELQRRAELVGYFRHSLFRLNNGGVMVVDTYGGPTAYDTGRYRVEASLDGAGFVYEWEQRRGDPLTGRVECAMHFEVDGGTRVEDAFVYDWRLWSVPEVRDAMMEAGYRSTEVHLDYGVGSGEEDGPVLEAAALDGEPTVGIEGDEDYVAYVVGRV